mgnify:CR=1 FL=1
MTPEQRAALAHLLAAHLPPHLIAPTVLRLDTPAWNVIGLSGADLVDAVRVAISALPAPYNAGVAVVAGIVERVLAMPDLDAPAMVVTDERD